MLGIMPSNLFLSLAQVIREYSTNKNRVPNTISVATIISTTWRASMAGDLERRIWWESKYGIRFWGGSTSPATRGSTAGYRDMIQSAVRSPSQVFNKGPSSRKVVNTLEKMA